MNLQLDLWQLLFAFGGMAAFFLTAMGVGIRILLSLYEKRLAERFDAIVLKLDAEASQLRNLERDFLLLKAQLPIDYVRRDDFVRTQTVIEAKLDGLALRIENVQLRGNHHAN